MVSLTQLNVPILFEYMEVPKSANGAENIFAVLP